MTLSEVEDCLTDFVHSHRVPPMLIVASDANFKALEIDMVRDKATDQHYLLGIKIMSDPEVKGIIVSS